MNETTTMPTEVISNSQWDSTIARIEKKNLAKYGQSPSRATISRMAAHFIIEISGDSMVVVQGWREALKRHGLLN